MLTVEELRLNRIAQGVITEDAGGSWFEALQPFEQKQALTVLAKICQQAHPIKEEVSLAIERARLKPTFTPCVLLSRAEVPEHSFKRIIGLPHAERLKSFRLLLSLFALADTRRREVHCKNGCTHEWHNLPPLQP
jgi:hypothetical protein